MDIFSAIPIPIMFIRRLLSRIGNIHRFYAVIFNNLRTFAFNNTSLLKKDRGSHNVSASAFHLLHIVIQTVSPHVSTDLSVSATFCSAVFRTGI